MVFVATAGVGRRRLSGKASLAFRLVERWATLDGDAWDVHGAARSFVYPPVEWMGLLGATGTDGHARQARVVGVGVDIGSTGLRSGTGYS